ncbi:hypothetical protein OH76DRAFT_947142 [Lentinus brumalis]|uniref:Uncharacterized protein n=1 Tax=Lentinus brumalis TaxID=2498619 RepID=A0A371CZ70_9APHY|nr:hypothetical protein OH76DRAFT_947142 [Polyporus brumalis]
MLAALPALRKLALEHVAWLQHGEFPSFAPGSLPPLTHLVWRCPDFQSGVVHTARAATNFLCVLRAACHSIVYLSLHEGMHQTSIASHAERSGGPLSLPRLSTLKLVETVDSALDDVNAPAAGDLPRVLGVLQQHRPFLAMLLSLSATGTSSQLRSVTFA